MAKPVILAVDDEPEVLNAIERDLRHHFAQAYRVMKAGSAALALEATRQLKQRGAPIALFLVDERMPGMSGTEFLVEALKLYPDSRRVLLTAYADTHTAIAGINSVGLDYYLLKPWEPPEERLYPPLDDLLLDWLVAKTGSPQPTDEALVSAYLNGEARAAEQIWQKHAPMVDRLLRRHRLLAHFAPEEFHDENERQNGEGHPADEPE